MLALPTLLLSLDLSVLYLALPKLGADLRPGSAQLLWITDIYGFMIAGFLVTMGTLGDRIGRRRLLLIGAAAFGVASVLAAYSGSAEMLIAARALLGIAGATLMPSTLALISNMFRDPGQQSTAVGVWMAAFLGGAAIGPVVGGLLLEWFWWGSVFLLGVPVMAVLLVAGPLLLPEYRDPGAGRLDPASVALSLAAILPVVYGLKGLAKEGPGTAPVLAILIGLGFGVAFVRRQRGLTSPLLDLRLFGSRTFSAALGVMLFGTVTMGGVNLFVTQYLQLVEGLSPLGAGLWMVPPALGTLVGILLAPAAAQRVRPAYVMAAALAVGAVGFLLLTRVDAASGLAVVVIGLTVCGLGIAPTGVLATNLVLGSAPPEKAGSASAVSETTGELGLALGVAAFGSLGTAVYRNRIDSALPADVPPRVAEAARETLAGATVAAELLPAQLGAELVDSAREAFTRGLNVVAGVSAVAVLFYAVLAVVLLRHVRPTTEDEETAIVTEANEEPVQP